MGHICTRYCTDLWPPHQRTLDVVNALGGYEGGVYRLGDEAYGCLKDLTKFWHKDETDNERTVTRILWASRVLPNDLVPIILKMAGKARRRQTSYRVHRSHRCNNMAHRLGGGAQGAGQGV
jgi:hypothetical protein